MKLGFTIAIILFLVLALSLVYALIPSSGGTRTFGQLTVHTFSSDFTNVHLVSYGDRHLMIDAGLDSQQQDLEAFIKSKGLLPSDLAALIVTHAHYDHAGTAAHFQAEHGVKVIAGQADLDYFQLGVNDRLCPTGWLAKARHGTDQVGTFKPFLPDILVADQINLSSLIGIPAEVFNLPGHTPGSLVIAIDDVVFVGDMFRGGILNKSSAAMHFYQCDLTTLHRETNALLEQLTPSTQTFFPSHLGPTTRAKVEKLLAKYGEQSKVTRD